MQVPTVLLLLCYYNYTKTLLSVHTGPGSVKGVSYCSRQKKRPAGSWGRHHGSA